MSKWSELRTTVSPLWEEYEHVVIDDIILKPFILLKYQITEVDDSKGSFLNLLIQSPDGKIIKTHTYGKVIMDLFSTQQDKINSLIEEKEQFVFKYITSKDGRKYLVMD